MPVVLSQIFLPSGRTYKDVEGALYHYPRQYFSRVTPFESFVYYRPLKSARGRSDGGTYFGHGTIGVPFEDIDQANHRFVDILQYETFPWPVSIRDTRGLYYETGTSTVFQAQSAVRSLSAIAYQRILAAADVAVTGVSLLPSTAGVTIPMYADVDPVGRRPEWPVDGFRTMDVVPPGAGYVPTGATPDVYESAALQERARADHQRVLRTLVDRTKALGGSAFYNNNLDLVARFGGASVLVEAKSLNDPRSAVDRMRYGMGQLFDYGVRYRAELQNATPLLAFGTIPNRETAWIADVLNENKVGFACLTDEGHVRPFNEVARGTPLFANGRS